ncbi:MULTISPECIES: hypothetical protein [Spiroplasma]|uniref:hypothetical protein n=1 Tax=Spiroplasma TaxID=2132 RepID=UPI0018DB0924|nr:MULTISPECIES: hypothetical protein [Spiroplasma]MBH8622805.1 hypothetical protein [Spiroplasma sp. hyd1]UNF61318.1 hypothetical protein MNU24_05225 [Spiroplasma poulsonii]
MNKTVKEIYDVNLDDIIQPHENEIVKKDKLIKNLENKWEELVSNNYELQQKQLFKEDFELNNVAVGYHDISGSYKNYVETWVLKENSDYDKLKNKKEQE